MTNDNKTREALTRRARAQTVQDARIRQLTRVVKLLAAGAGEG